MADAPSTTPAAKTAATAPAAKTAPKAPRTITVRAIVAPGSDGKPVDKYRWTPNRGWPANEDVVVEVVEPTQAKHQETGELITADGKPVMYLGDPLLENGRPNPHKIGQHTLRQLKANTLWFLVTEGGTIKAAAVGGDDKARILSLEAQLEELKAMVSKLAPGAANG